MLRLSSTGRHRSLRKVLTGQVGAKERPECSRPSRLDFILCKINAEGFQEEKDWIQLAFSKQHPGRNERAGTWWRQTVTKRGKNSKCLDQDGVTRVKEVTRMKTGVTRMNMMEKLGKWEGQGHGQRACRRQGSRAGLTGFSFNSAFRKVRNMLKRYFSKLSYFYFRCTEGQGLSTVPVGCTLLPFLSATVPFTESSLPHTHIQFLARGVHEVQWWRDSRPQYIETENDTLRFPHAHRRPP